MLNPGSSKVPIGLANGFSGDGSLARLLRSRWWLIAPLLIFLIIFFVIPIALLFASSLNPPTVGVVALQTELTLENFVRVFSRSMFYMSALRSVAIAATVSLLTLIIAYPMAYVIAKTRNVARNTLLTILVLVAMQLDMVIRLYGMMVILGDNGLINQLLLLAGLISEPLPLMYNTLGVILGLIQFALPFMILSLVGVIAGIDPNLEEAARSLGASRRAAFFSHHFANEHARHCGGDLISICAVDQFLHRPGVDGWF